MANDAAGNLLFDPLAKVPLPGCSSYGLPTNQQPTPKDCRNNPSQPASGFNPVPPPGCGFGQEYEYDGENRLTRVLRDTNNVWKGYSGAAEIGILAEYAYDALGRRVETKEYVNVATGEYGGSPTQPLPVLTTRHVYVGLETVQDWTERTDVTPAGYYVKHQYLWGDPERFPEPIAMMPPSEIQTAPGEPIIPDEAAGYHYLHDVLGSVIGLVDAVGTIVERYTYDPYGKVFIEKWNASANENQGAWEPSAETNSGMPYSPLGNPWMWTGYRYDAVVGKYHTPTRTYDPNWGRFLQRDPIEYEGGSINLYEYVQSAPLYWVDPLGLEPDDYEVAIRNRRNNTRNELDDRKAKAAQLVLDATEPENLIVVVTTLTPIPGDEVAAGVLVAGKATKGLKLGQRLKNLLGKAKSFFKGKGKKIADGADAATDAARSCPKGLTKPKGIPDDWIKKPSKKGGGDQYVNPGNPHDRARVMPGNPKSPNPAQQKPYVKRTKDGKAVDKYGNPVDPDSPEAHIPLDEFDFTE